MTAPRAKYRNREYGSCKSNGWIYRTRHPQEYWIYVEKTTVARAVDGYGRYSSSRTMDGHREYGSCKGNRRDVENTAATRAINVENTVAARVMDRCREYGCCKR
jgi:hypothetical protein